MNICHLVTKGFDEDMIIRRTIVYDGLPLVVGKTHTKSVEEVVNFNKSLPDRLNTIESLKAGKRELLESPIGSVVGNGEEILPLSSIYNYKVGAGDALSSVLPVGTSFSDLFEAEDTKEYMREVAKKLYPGINPNTGEQDIDENAFYTPYIPLVSLTGCIPPQFKGDEAFFNPLGTVSVAEYLDGLNSIRYGCNANGVRKKTLDNVSKEDDYFNEGYNSCLRGMSSPFFNLYTREELTKPITRFELAYITVICWQPFIERFNSLYGGSFYLGISFDWEVPSEVLSYYNDGFDYKVSKISLDTKYDIISLNIKDYKGDRSMSEYKDSVMTGTSAIPLPMFMSMLELGEMGLFNFEGYFLDPVKEVSRGEFCYFLSKLAKLFQINYKNTQKGGN